MNLGGSFPIFQSDGRDAFCIDIAATVAEIVAEILVYAGVEVESTPVLR